MYYSAVFHQNSYSNCGMEFWGFHQYHEGEKWSMEVLAQKMPQKPSFKHVVAFSGNSNQKDHPLGPHTFYEWLRKQKETVTASRWQRHNGHTIRCYFWYPSRSFIAKFNKAKKKSPPAGPVNSYYNEF